MIYIRKNESVYFIKKVLPILSYMMSIYIDITTPCHSYAFVELISFSPQSAHLVYVPSASLPFLIVPSAKATGILLRTSMLLLVRLDA